MYFYNWEFQYFYGLLMDCDVIIDVNFSQCCLYYIYFQLVFTITILSESKI